MRHRTLRLTCSAVCACYLLYFRVSVKFSMNESSLLRKSFLFFQYVCHLFPFPCVPQLSQRTLLCLRFVIFPGAWCCECSCTVVERKNQCARLGKKDITATLRYLMTWCSQIRQIVQSFGSEEEEERREIRAGSVELIAVRFFVEGNRWYDGAGLGFTINGPWLGSTRMLKEEGGRVRRVWTWSAVSMVG